MAVIRGFTRMRKHTFGKQSVFGTPVAPTIVVPWRGIPDINPNWTDDEDVDVGSIDPALPPYRTAMDVTVPYTGTLNYQNVPLIFGMGVRGGVTPTGVFPAKTWEFTALSLTPTELDYFTDQFTDDVTDDIMQLQDTILESFELSFGEDLGPWQFSGTGRASNVLYGDDVVDADIDVGSNFTKVYGADTELFINDAAGSIGSTKISDTLHSMSLRVEPTIDLKRFANGSNTRFQIAGYGYSGRNVTIQLQMAKTDEALAEVVKWLSEDPVNRFISLKATSPVVLTGSTHHSLDIKLGGTWRTRTDGDIGGNAVFTLEGRAQYIAGLGYPLRATVVTNHSVLP